MPPTVVAPVFAPARPVTGPSRAQPPSVPADLGRAAVGQFRRSLTRHGAVGPPQARPPRPAPAPLRPPRVRSTVRPRGRTAARARARCAPTPTPRPRSGAGSPLRPATPPQADRGAAGGPVGAAALDPRPPRITDRARPLRAALPAPRAGGDADLVSHRALPSTTSSDLLPASPCFTPAPVRPRAALAASSPLSAGSPAVTGELRDLAFESLPGGMPLPSRRLDTLLYCCVAASVLA
jgi:hypothetical protein